MGQGGFVLTYDLSETGRPQLDVLTAIVCWSCEPRRHAQWLRCCARWLVVVPDVACFQLTRLLLNGTLFLYPPPCDLLLVHEARGPLGDEAVIWEPDPTVACT